MMANNKLTAKFHILINQKGIDKELFLSDNFGKSSTKELTADELVAAVNILEGNNRPRRYGYQPACDEIRKLRSDILSLLTKSPSVANIRQRGLGLPNDWAILNTWIERHSGGKRLNMMSLEELKAFKRQLVAIRAKGWFYREPKAEPSIKDVERYSRRDYAKELLVMHEVPGSKTPVS